jgi:TolB-like protein/DNA-binding winged helix-turn-helix (wHTH) protein/Tfp pilus assembly protein PilF
MPQRFGVFELDSQTGELRKSGARVRLAPQPFTVLSILVSRPGEVVTREELRAAVWGDNTFIEFDQGLNTCIRQIRAVLGDDADVPRFVETLPRRGYRLIAPVESIGGVPAAPSQTAVVEAPPRLAAPSAFGWRSAVAMAALALATAAMVGWPALRTDPPGNNSPITVAVLPLSNLSKDVSDDFLADGVTEALIHDLAQVRSIRVISRTSVMRFKDTTTPLRDIAGQLGANLILEGSYQQSSDRVRVTLQLVEAATDHHVFSRTFETTTARLFDTQREIARQIAAEVATEILPSERERLNASRSVNPEAYREYLLGRHFWNRRGRDNLRTAEAHFKRAVEIDPLFALGHAGLAETYVLLGDSPIADIPQEEASKLTHAYARRALELDPSLGEAYAAMGLARLQFDWEWDASERDFKRALELSPNWAMGWSWYGWVLLARGRFDEAIDAYERARAIDPLSLTSLASSGDAYYYARRYDEAMARYEQTLKMDPTYIGAIVAKGRLLETLRRSKEAHEFYQEYLKTNFEPRIYLASIRLQADYLGDMDGAKARLAEIRRGEKRSTMPVLFRISEAFIINDYDAGFAALNDAIDERAISVVFMVIGAAFDDSWGDPRLTAAIRRINPELEEIKRRQLGAPATSTAAAPPR